jgi:hypothetical protein
MEHPTTSLASQMAPTQVFSVQPGDVMFASVHFDGPPPSKSCGGMVCQEYDTSVVTDQTTGQTWTRKLACNTGTSQKGSPAATQGRRR